MPFSIGRVALDVNARSSIDASWMEDTHVADQNRNQGSNQTSGGDGNFKSNPTDKEGMSGSGRSGGGMGGSGSGGSGSSGGSGGRGSSGAVAAGGEAEAAEAVEAPVGEVVAAV